MRSVQAERNMRATGRKFSMRNFVRHNGIDTSNLPTHASGSQKNEIIDADRMIEFSYGDSSVAQFHFSVYSAELA